MNWKVIFQIDKHFEKDLKKQKDPALNKRFLKLIALLQELNSLEELPNIKKLAGFGNYYRIKLGDYRLGI